MAASINQLNTIRHGDCIAGMNSLPAGSVDLAFADPPFNIGYEYDVYDDRKERDHYLGWSRDWIAAVHRVLKDDGTFWLAIGDEYAAELKIASQDVGFHCRSWVIWYYTFGVNCKFKFSRSHAHLFYFVKDTQHFTFLDEQYRIPSARQLVYNDKRANPKGRLPDDTWIIPPADASGEMTAEEEDWGWPVDTQRTYYLRPQDLEGRFAGSEDTWYFPRVAGTFKERAGFHGCQMPEQLLGRIIRLCSREDELVFDPFSGSATTLAVAKKLNRQFLGFDLSEDYVRHGLRRLDTVQAGDLLEGAVEPLLSAPKTVDPTTPTQRQKKKVGRKTSDSHSVVREPAAKATQKTLQAQQAGSATATTEFEPLTESRPLLQTRHELRAGILEAFARSYDGYSADRVVAHPELNANFLEACREQGLAGGPAFWNVTLFALRKSGALSRWPASRTSYLTPQESDGVLFGSEIAMRRMLDRADVHSIDQFLCDPDLAADFDEIVQQFAPGAGRFEARWGALKLRKNARLARNRADRLPSPVKVPEKGVAIEKLDASRIPETPGVFLVRGAKSAALYAGYALNLKSRIKSQFGAAAQRDQWAALSNSVSVAVLPLNVTHSELVGYQCALARQYQPLLNFSDLWA